MQCVTLTLNQHPSHAVMKMKFHSLSSSFALIFLLLFVIGCADEPPKIPPSTFTANDNNAAQPSEYKFDVGDVFDIKFFYNPELSDSATVRPDGKINLQLVGELPVKGLTPQQLEQHIKEAYRGIIRRPAISVIARKFAVQRIFVGGEVATPGVVSLDGRLTALQAIMSVGGFKNSAQTDSVVVLKNNGQSDAAYYILDLNAHLQHESMQDAELGPYDVVFVPKRKISEIASFFKDNINEILPFYKNSGITFPFMYYLNPGAVQGTTTTK